MSLFARLRAALSDASPVASWPDLEAKSFQALLRQAATLTMLDDSRGAVEEVIAQRGRDLLSNPDPTDLGNPYSFLAWVGANHAQVVREFRALARLLLLGLPMLCFLAAFLGAGVAGLVLGWLA